MGIQAKVIQQNGVQFNCNNGNGTIGQVMQIPCGASIDINGDYWAVPAKDFGIYTKLYFQAYTAGSVAPTYDSFRVFRIQDKWSENLNVWWVRGTVAQYEQACADCCGGNGSTLPTDTPFIFPCQRICDIQDSVGNYVAYFGLPSLSGGQTYHPYAAINNVEAAAATAGGYANTTTLLNYLNTSATNIGSPAIAVTWSVSADNMTLIATTTGNTVGNSICAAVNNFYTSP